MSNRKSPGSMTVQVVFDTGDLTPVDRRAALDRAKKWAWYEALHAKDRDSRADRLLGAYPRARHHP